MKLKLASLFLVLAGTRAFAIDALQIDQPVDESLNHSRIGLEAFSTLPAPAANLNYYLWTCTAAPYNNYNYNWYYWQSYNGPFAQSQALSICNSNYGAAICVVTCR